MGYFDNKNIDRVEKALKKAEGRKRAPKPKVAVKKRSTNPYSADYDPDYAEEVRQRKRKAGAAAKRRNGNPNGGNQ